MNLRRLLGFVVNLLKFTAAERKDLDKGLAFGRCQADRRCAAKPIDQTSPGWSVWPIGFLSSKMPIG